MQLEVAHEQDVASAVSIHVAKLEVVWPAIGAAVCDNMTIELRLPPLRSPKPHHAVRKAWAVDTIRDHIGMTVAVHISNPQPVNALEFAIHHVERPRSFGSAGILQPCDTEVRTRWRVVTLPAASAWR